MELSQQEGKLAFAYWLRSGRWPTVRLADGTELKFNPYHDPRNGQFTFAPGGRARAQQAKLAPGGQGPAMRSGSNSRAFQIPMTLQQTFRGLNQMPGGSIIALADNILDLSGPADALQAALAENWRKDIIAQIRAVDPTWRFDQLAPAKTAQGRNNELNFLKFQHAAVMLRVKGDAEQLKLETLRVIQESADRAYERGLIFLQEGRLKVRLSEPEALGNYIDREVRRDLRSQYRKFDIDYSGKGSVRINKREDDTSGTDATYRRPDARVDDVAFDVTLTRKTLATPQVRGFFGADFKPNHVVIVRPRQIGEGSTYIISRPETKR